MSEWQPIETAPRDSREMFVVQAFAVKIPPRWMLYTTDPYCVWRDRDKFVRWPHDFPPTHWMPLPPPPTGTPEYIMPQFQDVIDTVNALSIRSKE